MEWQTPKTDWQIRYDENGRYAGDYFEAEDYQRIAGNIEYLQQLAQELYALAPAAALPKITSASFAYAEDMNALENGLEDLLQASFLPAGTPPFSVWKGNAPGPGPEDLNRLENICAVTRENLTSQAQARQRLAITLGGVQF